jgi:hypothetical protein
MTVCARPGCDNPLPPSPGRGRPPIYCSPACRPSLRHPSSRLNVEIDHPDHSPDGRPADRVWTVRLRRGQRTVTIADNLGWPSATALAAQLDDLLIPRPRHRHPPSAKTIPNNEPRRE